MGVVNGADKGERGDGSYARHRHEPAYRLVGFGEFANLGIVLRNLLGQYRMGSHQRIDKWAQMGCFAKQGGDPRWQYADASLADDEAEALQQASHLILQIAAQIDQLATSGKHGPDLSAPHALDLGFAIPTYANQLSSRPLASFRSVLLIRIDRRPCYDGVQTDHRESNGHANVGLFHRHIQSYILLHGCSPFFCKP